MRGGVTEVNETQKWAKSKNRLRTTDLIHATNYEGKSTLITDRYMRTNTSTLKTAQ
jgi:hypothetical protein